MPEGSVVLPVTPRGILRLSADLRHRYLGGDVTDWTVVQAVGYDLSVRLWSDVENVLLLLPLDGYRAGEAFVRQVHNEGINVSRWLTPGNARSDEAGDWTERGALAVDADDAGSSVEATVETFVGVTPDV